MLKNRIMHKQEIENSYCLTVFSVTCRYNNMAFTLRCSYELLFFKKLLKNILEKFCARHSFIESQKINFLD